ncbi:MAG: Lar family restriction alleviation protein [Pseudomonadota bacterium]
MTDKTEALKPCPFCDGSAKVDRPQYCYPPRYFAICTFCGASTANYSNREAAASNWNRRHNAPSEPLPDELLAMRRAGAPEEYVTDIVHERSE